MITWQTTSGVDSSILNKFPAFKKHTNNIPCFHTKSDTLHSCKITNAGYDGLHVFLWGTCCNSPNWEINPYEPELMGCGWMSYPWKREEYPDLIDLINNMHNEIASSITEDILSVKSTNLILPAHEEEILGLTIKQGVNGDIIAVRPQPLIFNVEEQLSRLVPIHEFVIMCQENNLDFRVKRKYNWKRHEQQRPKFPQIGKDKED